MEGVERNAQRQRDFRLRQHREKAMQDSCKKVCVLKHNEQCNIDNNGDDQQLFGCLRLLCTPMSDRFPK